MATVSLIKLFLCIYKNKQLYKSENVKVLLYLKQNRSTIKILVKSGGNVPTARHKFYDSIDIFFGVNIETDNF